MRLVFSYIFIWNFERGTGKLAHSRLELIPSRTPNVSPLCSSRHTLWCLVGHNWHSNYTTFSNNLDHQHFWKKRKCEKKCYVKLNLNIISQTAPSIWFTEALKEVKWFQNRLQNIFAIISETKRKLQPVILWLDFPCWWSALRTGFICKASVDSCSLHV